ncbi:hypothetical protein ACQHIV_26995 [Kribbella sp. GL6]|uniref:hypothetical protein n=1 Tax=Kribbella sp. GL6 TaxID=3419765 RepID=UPI003D0224E6
MKRLVVTLWVVSIGASTYAYTRALVERSHATGKSQLHIFLTSGEELFIWHQAPGWFYPVLWPLSILTFALTIVYARRR